MRTFAIILAFSLLGACGTKGALVLPPKPVPTGAATPATLTPAPADDSKAGSGATR